MTAMGMPGGVIAMTSETADRLLTLGQGDSTLLYLALLRHSDLPAARRALNWSQGRVDAAYPPLVDAKLVLPLAVTNTVPAAPARSEADYRTEDLIAAVESDPSFCGLQQEVERRLGKILSTSDLKRLFWIYDALALPAEVALLAVMWSIEEMERKYGPGRRPRMSQIEALATRWRNSGLDTAEAVEHYLQGQSGLRSREKALLPLVGVRDRMPLDKEREYLSTWVDWGFSDQVIAMAYERTLLKKQSMNWPYMNSILKSWHQKGLHTPSQIQQEDKPPQRDQTGATTPAATTAQRETRIARDMAALKRNLAQMK